MADSQQSPGIAPGQPSPHDDDTLLKRTRKRRWPWLVVLVLIVLPVLLYALLPWLIPTTWLKQQITDGIEDNFGRTASISSIEISWTKGIIVRDITIDRLEQFGSGHLFKASKLQMDFRPLRMLLQRKLGSILVDRPQLWIVADPAGTLNLSTLPSTGSQAAAFEQISITNTDLHFIDQAHQRQARLSIPSITMARQPHTPSYTFLAHGQLDPTTKQPVFTLQVRFIPPGTEPNMPEMAVRGWAEFVWANFDLANAPLPRLPSFDLQFLAGRTSGRARLELYSDGRIDLLDCIAAVDDLHLQVAQIPQHSSAQPLTPEWTDIRIPKARLMLHGSYEFVTGQLTLPSLSATLPGLDFSASLQGRFFPAERTFLPTNASCSATVQPSRLQQQFAFLDQMFRRHELTLTGSTALTIDFEQTGTIDRMSVSLDALDTGLHLPNILHKSAGTACDLNLSAIIDHNTGILTLDKPLSAKLGSARLSLHMQLAQPLRMASFLDLLSSPAQTIRAGARQWRQANIAGDLQIEQVRDLVTICPLLAPVFSAEGFTMDGPIHAELRLQPSPSQENKPPDHTQLSASIVIPGRTRLEFLPYFNKTADLPLSLSFKARLPAAQPSIDDVTLSCRLGQSGISLKETSIAFVPCNNSSTNAASPTLADSFHCLSTSGQFQIKKAQILAEALTPLQDLHLSGNAAGRFSLRYDPLHSLLISLTLDATDLGLRIPLAQENSFRQDHSEEFLFEKAANIPATLNLESRALLPSNDNHFTKPISLHELKSLTPSQVPFRMMLDWTLANSSGAIEINHKLLLPDAPNATSGQLDSFTFALKLTQLDLYDLQHSIPLLTDLFSSYQLGGHLCGNLTGRLNAQFGLEELDFYADLINTQGILRNIFTTSDETTAPVILQKSAPLPLTIKARLTQDSRHKQGYRSLTLESGCLTAGNSRLYFAGSCLLTDPPPGPGTAQSTGFSNNFAKGLLPLENLLRIHLRADGRLVLDQHAISLSPQLADIDRRFGLAGSLDCHFDLDADSAQAAITCKLSSPGNTLKLGPAVFQRVHSDLQLFFDQDAEDLAISGVALELPVLELMLFEKPVRLSGDLTFMAGRLDISDLFISVDNSSARLTARLESIRTAPSGHISLYSHFIDQPSLTEFASKAYLLLQSNDHPSAGDQAQDTLQLSPMDINFRAACDNFILALPGASEQITLRQLGLSSQLTSTSLLSQFTACVNGGRVGCDLSISFDKPGLPLTCRYEALELFVDQAIAPLLSQVFPDMVVTGTITESRDITANILAVEDAPPFNAEHGRTVLRQGTLEGPSAPAWVIYWFPKLSLTKYPFDVADNVFSKDQASGITTNDMVLIGQGRYNIYISGTTKPDNATEYTMGVDLSPRAMTLEQRHNWKQFRVPIMNYSGQIIDHKWANRTVSFVWPTRTAWDIFIKNNALRTLIERRRRED